MYSKYPECKMLVLPFDCTALKCSEAWVRAFRHCQQRLPFRMKLVSPSQGLLFPVESSAMMQWNHMRNYLAVYFSNWTIQTCLLTVPPLPGAGAQGLCAIRVFEQAINGSTLQGFLNW